MMILGEKSKVRLILWDENERKKLNKFADS